MEPAEVAVVLQPSTIEYEQVSSKFKRKHEEMLARRAQPMATDEIDMDLSSITKMIYATKASHEAQTALVKNLRADAGRHQHEQALRSGLLEVASLYTLNGVLARQRVTEVVAVAIKCAIDAGKLAMVNDQVRVPTTDKANTDKVSVDKTIKPKKK
jgi:hypothetical protein